jgi:branched-chain amino acid transport system substrate-binding protein
VTGATPEPLVVGVLLDHGGPESPMIGIVRHHLDQAVAERRLDRPVRVVTEAPTGLPLGSAAAVERGFERLLAQDPLLVLGPSITDNALVVRELADRAQVPCCNWSGTDRSRSEWMFHYQIGSLEEEPSLLAGHLSDGGAARVVVVQDRSPIGARYGAFFEAAADAHGLRLVGRATVSPVVTDLGSTVAELQRHDADAVVYLGLGLSARALAVAMSAAGWRPTVVANSALMFGWANPAWTVEWEGWTYVDAWSEENPRLAEQLAAHGDDPPAPTMLAAGDDLGRLAVAALAGAEMPRAAEVKAALERVKWLPATLGQPGTTMGFGQWERGALKGGFLVLRRWEGGRSVVADRQVPT